MTEREQAHRHVLEDKVVGTEGWVKIAGQWFAIFALILSLFVVALFAYWDHPKEGAALGVTIIVGVVALFLGRGRWRGASTAPADEE